MFDGVEKAAALTIEGGALVNVDVILFDADVDLFETDAVNDV